MCDILYFVMTTFRVVLRVVLTLPPNPNPNPNPNHGRYPHKSIYLSNQFPISNIQKSRIYSVRNTYGHKMYLVDVYIGEYFPPYRRIFSIISENIIYKSVWCAFRMQILRRQDLKKMKHDVT